ncbi:MAG: zinc dependent phospholipase C family protein [Phycisphaerae bacterium]|nr:zinc dependent phospholipase C family protein [Phycisphaerae bacterium]
MIIVILAVLAVFGITETTYGWGLATHVELAETILNHSVVLVSAVGAILLRYRNDFVLGNLLADVMIAKKMSRRRKTSHHWTGALRLLANAEQDRTRAFAYGFLTHLAADTVAHNHFIPQQIARTGTGLIQGHLYWEMMADQLTNPANRKTIRKLLQNPYPVHQQAIELYLYPQMKWFGFNKSIFTHINRLACGKRFARAARLCNDMSIYPLENRDLQEYKSLATERMVDIVLKGKNSLLLREDPNGGEERV